MFNWVDNLLKHYQMDENHFCSLSEKINELETRVQVLEEENISLTNELYRLENSLEARIDILASEPKIIVNEEFNSKTS